MAMRKDVRLAASESVRPGHPDKLCDMISDAILDEAIRVRPEAHVACETVATRDLILVAGEVSEDVLPVLDFEAIARSLAERIGYDRAEVGLDARRCEVAVRVSPQSPDINRAVVGGHELGAGDQGMMFGFATDETPELMPAAIAFAHRLVRRLDEVRPRVEWLRPDGKSQVVVEYDGDGRPARVRSVVMSVQHDPGVPAARRQEVLMEEVVKRVIPASMLDGQTEYFLSKQSEFVKGGPAADTGLTGRKIIVDTYGGRGRHGGGAFSGKDPSKVDRSGAYAARHAAQHVVRAGLARQCEVQVAYVIGISQPVCLQVETFGTARPGLSNQRLADALGEVFSFRPAAIIRELDLLRPIYAETAAFGHFGRPGFPWERYREEAGAALQRLAS
jgi:S-adenosylmethionine synthetase